MDENGKITHYVAVKEDITERKQASVELQRTHEELEKTNRELEKASKVKSQFLANMSHEIRTPLNAIIGMTGMLLDTPLAREQQNYAETVRNSGELLLTLINDILDFSKIEAEKMELENQAFNLRQCIEEALDLIVTKATQKKIELAYLIKDDLPAYLIGDITRLRQILVNLLSNSIKFTDSGEVVITVNGQLRDQHQVQLHFAIRDTGLGIPPDRLNRLFQSFSQVDTSTTRRYGGTGLGLAISKQLSELMGGRMWVESTGIPGEGSTFHFTILVKEAPDQEPQQTNNQERVALNGLRILIVDDNPTNREILLHYTNSWNMLPTAVGSGQETLDLLRNKMPFDLAILDLQMPDMDGVSLAKEIHQLLQKSAFPLILLSSLGYREAQSDETVFNAYLTKPIKPSELYDVLGTTISGRSNPIMKKFSTPSTMFDRELGLHHPLRVLVVEDNNVNQTVALSMLGKIGYRADVANNGLEALDALHRQTYDIVFMDGQMPIMDGKEATIQIRQQLPADQQPFIAAMTANAMQGDRERYLSYGMNDYISKPIRMEDLVRALTTAQPLNQLSSNAVELLEEPENRAGQLPDPQLDIPSTSMDAILSANQAETKLPAALNPKPLQELQEMMGDEGQAMVANLIKLYINDSQTLIEKMQIALLATDCDTLRREAHTLKGNSNQVGAEILANLCAGLEKLAKANSTTGADDWIDQIRNEFERVKIGLNLQANLPIGQLNTIL